MSNAARPVVVVVGSLHYDIMVDAPDRPRKGETVTGYAWRPKFGGKGGNQAVAAAKAGADVKMAGAVGNDDFGRYLLQALSTAGVDATRVEQCEGVGSGMSVAISDDGGDYGAVIVSGANLRTRPDLISDADLWRHSNVLILQNEMLESTNIVAARSARSAGATVCLNAAPYRPMSDELLALIDVLIVNAIEAEQLGGLPIADLASATVAARALSPRFPVVVVTAGGDGVVGCKRGEPAVSLAAFPVTLISTHGAGDVFVGALAAAIGGGKAFADCLDDANRAAALHVSTKPE